MNENIVKINPTEIINKSWFDYGSFEEKEKLTWTDVPGWFSHFDSYKSFVDSFPNGSVFVEIGTFMGKSTCCMAELIKNSGKNIKFYTIDTFLGSEGEEWHTDIIKQLSENSTDLYHQFLYYAKSCQVNEYVIPIVSSSVKASMFFGNESLDLIFIDGGHTYSEVLKDIESWYPKLKKGGIISGDDYGTWEGVTNAVNEYFKNQSIEIATEGSLWKCKKF